MSLDRLDGVGALVAAQLAEEVQTGFPNLRRTPSSGVIGFLDYFDGLGAMERDALLKALARGSALGFLFPVPAVCDEQLRFVSTDPALLAWRQAAISGPLAMGLRYQSLRMTKWVLNDPMSVQMMAETRAKLDFVPRDDVPLELAPDPDRANIQPAKAPMLRTLINKALGDLFPHQKRKLPGGETIYEGDYQGSGIKVAIDFAARDIQLRYGVSIADDTRTVFAFRMTYENLWAADPSWDYLTEENAERSIGLLCGHIGRIVQLRNAVFARLRGA